MAHCSENHGERCPQKKICAESGMDHVYYKEWRARQGTVRIEFNDIRGVGIEHTSLSRIALPFVNSRGRAPRFLPLPLPPVGLRRAEATAASAALVTSLTLSPLPVY
jgi:hypothetical protein